MRGCLVCEYLRASCLESSARLAAAREQLAQYRIPEVSAGFRDLSSECREALQASRFLREKLCDHLRQHRSGGDTIAAVQ